MNPITRTHYLIIAKLIRNADMEEKARKHLAKEFVDFISKVTPCFDKKRFMEIATHGKDNNLPS